MPPQPAISVAELDRRIKRAVEGSGDVWVEGEVASLKIAGSGHLYFTLKDEREEACIDCVMYRAFAARARQVLKDGARVQVRGRPTFWLPRGRVQLIVDAGRIAGRGALLEALAQLKAKLAEEGLFAAERKKKLPAEPRIVGIVTSAAGAAVHDIAKVAFRRGGAHLLLAPAMVQGVGAAAQIVAAIDRLERVSGVDVIIVGRGGGATDDLSAFNDEALVRRIAACRVPVVSAVGHEIDVTLTDLVADVRAATPSHAAELVVPELATKLHVLRDARMRLGRAMHARIVEDRMVLERIRRQLGDPRLLVGEKDQLVDELRARAEAAIRRAIAKRRDASHRLVARLSSRHPRAVLESTRADVASLEARLRAATDRRVATAQKRLGTLAARLDALSPLAVLSRGYSIALTDDGRAILYASSVSTGERIHVRVHAGRIAARVESTTSGDEDT